MVATDEIVSGTYSGYKHSRLARPLLSSAPSVVQNQLLVATFCPLDGGATPRFVDRWSLVPDLPVPPASGFRHPCLNIERIADTLGRPMGEFQTYNFPTSTLGVVNTQATQHTFVYDAGE